MLHFTLACVLLLAFSACDSRRTVEAYVQEAQQDTPIMIDDATTLIEVGIENDNVVYRYLVDEEQISIKELSTFESDIREALKANCSKDEKTREFTAACAAEHMSIIMIYAGKTSHETFTITFKPEELAHYGGN